MVFLAEVPQAAVRRAGQDAGSSRTWLHSPTGMGNSCRCQVALSSPTPSFLLFSFFLQALTISFPIFSPFSSYYFSFFFSPPLLAQHSFFSALYLHLVLVQMEVHSLCSMGDLLQVGNSLH